MPQSENKIIPFPAARARRDKKFILWRQPVTTASEFSRRRHFRQLVRSPVLTGFLRDLAGAMMNLISAPAGPAMPDPKYFRGDTVRSVHEGYLGKIVEKKVDLGRGEPCQPRFDYLVDFFGLELWMAESDLAPAEAHEAQAQSIGADWFRPKP
jgi:hypothetical protein